MEPLIYLASRSPRRSGLLKQIALPHTLLDVEVEEAPHAGEAPEDYVVRLALYETAELLRGEGIVLPRPYNI